MSKCDVQAENFCKKYNVAINTQFSHYGKHFGGNDDKRDIYNVTIMRIFPASSNWRCEQYSFQFGQSIVNSYPNKRKRPTDYEILACLEKSEVPLDVWEFAREYGYEINSREFFYQVETVYLACQKEYQAVLRLFADCLEELQEIS